MKTYKFLAKYFHETKNWAWAIYILKLFFNFRKFKLQYLSDYCPFRINMFHDLYRNGDENPGWLYFTTIYCFFFACGPVFYDRKKELHVLKQAVETCFHSQSELVFNELLHDGMDIREQFSPFIYFFIWAQNTYFESMFCDNHL